MRLKQLLVLIPLLAILAAGASPELKNISLVSQGNTTVVTIQATGAFRHNDYRPVENIMFVDFPGVSAGKLLDRAKTVQLPGLTGYRVVGFSGAGGVSVARVELNLAPGADVKLSDGSGAVTVQLTGSATSAKPQPDENASQKPAEPIPARKDAANQPTAKATAPPAKDSPATGVPVDLALVRNISVTRADGGMQVEITGTLPMQPATQVLTNPDRIVIDLPNSAPASRPHPIKVNAGNVVSVRMGQFQQTPPLTRVVVDLRAPAQFDVAQKGSSVVLKLRPSEPAVQTQPSPVKSEVAKSEAPKTPGTQTEEVAANVKPAQANTAVVTNVATKPAAMKAVARKQPKPVAPVQTSAPAEAKAAVSAPKPAAEVVQASAKPADAPANKPLSKGSEEKPVAAAATSQNESEKTAGEFVFVQPNYKPKSEATAAAKPAEAAPSVATAQKPAVVAMNTQQPPSAPPAQPQPTQPAAVQPAVNFAAEQRQLQGATIVDKPRYTGEPISVNLKDVDLKDFFRLIHDISGLNIVLDPGVSGSLTLVLDDVPWDQALDIVLKNNGLDRQLEGNVLRIATLDSLRREADLRRAQIQAQALAVDKVSVTRFLSYAHSKDVLPTVKKLLSARGDVITDDRTNALIIQDIPSVIPEIDRLLATLDRKTQEVEIEARVVAATRNFARDVGVQLGAAWGNAGTMVGGAPQAGTSPNLLGYRGDFPPPYLTTPAVKLTAPPKLGEAPNTTPAAIPFFSNLPAVGPTGGINLLRAAGNYRLDAILTFAESRGLLKVLSRPRVVTQNNIQAIVRQGLRVPVVTLGQLGGPPTVSYVDAFLRLTVTPQVTAENTIFLNVDVENTTADFGHQVQGNPTLITQQATTQVLVTDGGTVVIGGVIQTQNSVTVDQVPLLGDIPVIGNLFKRRAKSTDTQELIFFITPKIIQT